MRSSTRIDLGGFSADALMARARAEAGLSNFGDDGFRPALEKFILACWADGFVSADGLPAIGDKIVRILVSRLRFEQALLRNPEILEEQIVSPLFIVGAGRVGSTKLHRLLANATEVQTTPLWQVMNPVPLADLAGSGQDPRVAIAEAFCSQIRQDQPQLYAAIEPVATAPDEDPYMFDLSFMQLMFLATANVPSYVEWIYQQDWDAPVRYHKKLLQYLQWQNHTSGLPMLLKGPSHTPHIDVLAAIFPGARFVQIHRDPLTSIASMAKVVWMLHRLQPVPHLDTIRDSAETQLQVMRHFLVESLKTRQAHPEISIVDFYYEEVRDDATGLARRIFDYWGIPLSKGSVQRMQDWERQNTQHALGRFVYTVAEAQIDINVYNRDFASYLARFFPANRFDLSP